MMQRRTVNNAAHPTRPLQTVVSGLFAAVLNGHTSNETLPSHETHNTDVITDNSRNLILGELYLQNWR